MGTAEEETTAGHSSSEFDQAAAIGLLWIALLVTGALVSLLALHVGPAGYDVENVLFEVASAQGNVGLTSGITGPEMPTVTKFTFMLHMWIGRLEIIPVFVLFRVLLTGFEADGADED